MRYEEKDPISLRSSSFYNPFAGVSEGTLINPGIYSIEMAVLNEGEMTNLVDPKSFNVIALNNTVMPAEDRNAKVEFQRKVSFLFDLLAEWETFFLKDKKEIIKPSRNPLR